MSAAATFRPWRPATATGVAPDAGARLFEPLSTGGGITLEQRLIAIWDDLTAAGESACPVCGDRIRAAAACDACGATLD